MNICMFTNTYLPHVGGVARSVVMFSRDLAARGNRVMVVAPTYAGYEEPEDGAVEVLRVPAIQNFNGSDFSVRIALPFVIDEAIDRFGPDLIHSHHPFLLGDAALRAARRRGLPLILTHHTLYERYTHYVPLDSPAMKRFVINLSTRYANLCNAVVAPSLSVARLLRERGVRGIIREIPTGVDLKFFQQGRGEVFRREHGIPEEAPVMGHVGRLAPEKNLEYLALAAAECLKEKPDAWFVVIGDGPSRTSMEEVFRERGVSGRFAAPGSKSGQDLADAYSAMDLFVFSSTSETQGMVLAEAMATGTPVVALDASGTREVVEDGVNGRLLPENTSEDDFARAALGVLADPEALQKMGLRALEAARALSRERCAERMESLYEEVLTEPQEKTGGPIESLDPWDSLLGALRAEWELISGKAGAAVYSLTHGEDQPDPR